jgi:hypothetical protein
MEEKEEESCGSRSEVMVVAVRGKIVGEWMAMRDGRRSSNGVL